MNSDFTATDDADQRFMGRALELARRGEGRVEPNPMVGCVVVLDGKIVGEGWHRQFGGPHAEIEALQSAGEAAAGATLHVTLEPCCHTGKTPPCTQAIIAAKVARVIVACEDPNPLVAGSGLTELRAAGIQVQSPREDASELQTDNLSSQADDLSSKNTAQRLIAPFAKLITQQKPWIIAKWAMTLDGKLATHTGSSQWISNAASREVVHELRGRVDAIVVGRGTVEQDDPLLTARPSEPDAVKRIASRIVLDTAAKLSVDRRVAHHVEPDTAPVIIATGEFAGDMDFEKRCHLLQERGIEIIKLPGRDHAARLEALLVELGRRQMTNVLVEGGSQLFGTLFDLNVIDEVHVFVAPKLVGGAGAPSPISGQGIASMADALQFDTIDIKQLDDDVYILARKKSDG